MNKNWYLFLTESAETPSLEFQPTSPLTYTNFTRKPQYLFIYLLCINPAIIIELKSNLKLMKYGGKILGFDICGISKAAWNCNHSEEGMTGQIHRYPQN